MKCDKISRISIVWSAPIWTFTATLQMTVRHSLFAGLAAFCALALLIAQTCEVLDDD